MAPASSPHCNVAASGPPPARSPSRFPPNWLNRMKRISRRTFSGTVFSASALVAQERADPASPAKVELPAWASSPPVGDDPFEFPGPPSPRTRWNVPGPPRKYFSEWLPALFARTIEIDHWSGANSQLRWVFTGPSGGFTVEVSGSTARLLVRYYDSPGLSKVPPVQPRPGRHPEGLWEESRVEYSGDLKGITVVADFQLMVRVLLNGKEVLSSRAALDVNRHQLAFAGDGPVRGRLLTPAVAI